MKISVILIVGLLMFSALLVGCKEPVGSSCGTVTPGENDACCAERNKDVKASCPDGKPGMWKYVGGDMKDECEFICDKYQAGEDMADAEVEDVDEDVAGEVDEELISEDDVDIGDII